MENLESSNNQIKQKGGKIAKFAPLLFGALFLANPGEANAQTIQNQSRTNINVSDSTILQRLDKKLGVSLPDEYNQKVLDFVINDTIMKTKSATAYTEEFIYNKMQEDRGINKQYQLLFIRSDIYEGISKSPLYDRLDDENEQRSEAFENIISKTNNSYEEYKKGFKIYMEAKSAEYDRQSAEARQQSAEARQQSAEYDRQSAEYDRQSAEYDRQSAEYDRQSAEARQRSAEYDRQIEGQDSLRVKEKMVEFYDIYTTNPNAIKQEDIAFVKNATKGFIADCKKRNIDYKAILIKEVGDRRKVDEMLKFYGIEE